jgi:shikimate kinase
VALVRCTPFHQGSVNSDKLYLVGFMGAGKTTIGRALSRRIGWRFEDIDERIETLARRSVASIFAQQGEPHFRQLERQVLGELLPLRQLIVATGGGTFAEPDNRALMLADGAVAWLDIPLSKVLERVPADGRRPLASDRTAMEQLYARRRLAYAEAHAHIDASRPPAETVERLLEWIGF